MDKLWNNIKEPKIDLTKYGHFSGTGVIIFGNFDIKFHLI